MEAMTALLGRVSQGALTEPPPSAEALQRALQAALRAPDHRQLRPWRFLTVAGEARAQLAQVFLAAALADNPQLSEIEQQRLLAMPLRAPLLIVAITCFREDAKVPAHEQLYSTGAAVQNLLLALHAQGYGAIWRTGWMADHAQVMARLGLTSDERIAGFIYAGTPVNAPRTPSALAVSDFAQAWTADAHLGT